MPGEHAEDLHQPRYRAQFGPVRVDQYGHVRRTIVTGGIFPKKLTLFRALLDNPVTNLSRNNCFLAMKKPRRRDFKLAGVAIVFVRAVVALLLSEEEGEKYNAEHHDKQDR